MKKMLSFIILIVISGTGYSQQDLKIYGSLQQIMHANDTSEKVRLNQMGPLFKVYGLGVVAGLDGEILILDGETYITRVWKTSLATDKSTDVGAALLVMTSVEAWDTLVIDKDLPSLKDLENYLPEEMGRDIQSAIPYLILSSHSEIRWHVVSSPANVSDMQNHKDLGISGKFKGSALVLGFYSKNHEGVFTHKGHITHMHFQSADRLYAGHVDEIMLNQGDKLLIPKYLQK